MGVMTMKMISRTSITSTIGVTLMSELTFLPSSLFARAIFVCLFHLDACGILGFSRGGAPFTAQLLLASKEALATLELLIPITDVRCASGNNRSAQRTSYPSPH